MSRAAIRCLGIGALLLALAIGCSKGEPRSSGSGDTSGGDAGGDADVCTAGTVSCSCDGGACVPGATCQDDTCAACTETLGCTCAGPSDCDDTEVCLHDVCVACTPRAEGCICGEGDVCDEGLDCQDGACVQPDCPTGQLGCACNAGACEAGNVCDSLTARCRAPASCIDQGCPPPQLCTSAASQDAVCLEDCDEGYVWDLISKSCVARSCSNTNCIEANLLCVDGGTGPVCEGCRPGFIDQGDGTCVRNPGVCADIRPECRALNRRCIELDSGGTTYAECGGCLAGFAVQPLNGECEPTVACADLDCATANRSCVDTDFSYCSDCLPDFIEDGGSCRPVVREEDLSCDAGEFAFPETPTSDAYCAAVPCPPGQAAMPDDSCDNTMFLCPASCTGAGQTGAVWPYRVATGLSAGVCFCETAPGYFYDLDKRAAVACDADDDGWLKVTARAALMSPDAAVRANARCTPQLVDRVVLFNDVSQSETVVYCATEPMLRGPFDAACPALLPVPLYESDIIDDDTLLAGPAGPVPYGLGSRRLEAKELNSLTKACSGRNDDFNGNSIADVAEWGRAGLPFTNPNKVAALAPFQELAYFVELHRGGFVTSRYGPVGRYNIVERSRCHDTVPLAYAAGASSYAAECTRNRDARYDSTAGDSSQIGIDFGRFDCSAVAGSCPTPVPVVETFADPVPADASLGLCQDGVTIPTAWRGMMHHSQYQCVVATDSPVSPDPLVPYLHSAADFVTQSGAGNGSLQLNSCDASPYVEGAAGESAPLTVTCEPADGTAVTGEQVGFAAVLYHHTSSGEAYTRGCINECAEWGSVCPGFGVTAGCVDRTDDFGQLECNACPQTGAECDNPDPATAHGPCAKGVYACVDSNAICDLDAEPQPEEGGEPGVDDDCDGLVDGTIAEAVFVDGAHGADATGYGLAPETPAQSIEWGLVMAGLSGRSTVLVAEGTYAAAGRIAVGAGVGPFVLEGYYRVDPSTYAPFHGPYTLRGGYSGSCAAGERWCYAGGAVTVTADVTVAVTSGGALAGDITVSGIDFVARNGTTGSRTSYGLLASGFGTGHTVRFERCGFYAGNGRAGASGQTFANRATDGSDGEAGTLGCENEARAGCGSCDPPLGAAGGAAPTCANGNPSAGGGAGGSAAKGGNQGSGGSNGGNPAVGGAMGGMAGGGVPAQLCDPNTLCAMTIIPQLVLPVGGAVCNYKGQDGGSPMTPLTAGAISCTTFGTGGQDDSVGTRGAGGYAGAGGGGGGGGGGGTNACNSYGGSGGGGGSGGCGGAGGRGGHNGGGSYAAFVSNASVIFSNCVLQAGNGGKGGEGGAGQAGGLGGLGGYLKAGILGDPWPELEAGLLDQCKSTMYGGTGGQDDASHGAMGGKGGDGQDGANGGPGAGGPSIALMTWGGSANITLEGDNTLQVGTPGSSGQTSAGQNIQAPAVLQGNETTFPCN